MSDELGAKFYVAFSVRRNDYGEPVALVAKTVTQSQPTPSINAEYVLEMRVNLPKSSLMPERVDIKIESPQDAIVALQQTAKDLSKP